MGKETKEMLKTILHNTEIIMQHLKIENKPAVKAPKNSPSEKKSSPKKMPAKKAKK
jgi:hypothetical protein